VSRILAFVLALPVLAAAAPPEPRLQVFSGMISDSECGLDHSIMRRRHHLGSDRACTRACVERFGQEYVLADHVSGEVYQLDDQKAVRPYPARLVRILGTLDPASGTIHVRRIEPIR
jgi:hypothetical protein